jgi:hypothetical protein
MSSSDRQRRHARRLSRSGCNTIMLPIDFYFDFKASSRRSTIRQSAITLTTSTRLGAPASSGYPAEATAQRVSRICAETDDLAAEALIRR